MKILRDFIFLLAIFGAVWIVFTKWNPFDGDLPIELITIEQEEQLGEKMIEMMSDNPSWEVNSSFADTAINIIANRLLDSMGLTDYDYHFTLVESSEVNAFALPGGNIMVYTGLIDFSESPNEVAAVLAHEIGHVEQKHVVDRILKEFSLGILFTVIAGGDAVILQDIFRSLISAKFNRSQEEDADDFALRLLEKSKIRPSHMVSFFKRLKAESGDLDESLEPLMSHPALNSRIKKSYEYQLKEGFEDLEFDLDWEKVKLGLNQAS